MTRRTRKQRDQLLNLNATKSRKALNYAFRMSPFIHSWEAEGMTQREIVVLLNEAKAPVPSEYTGEPYAPIVKKEWSLVQYQRFRKNVDEVEERMVWYAKRRRQPHTRPFGDGAGLFADPWAAGLDYDPNKTRKEDLTRSEAASLPLSEFIAWDERQREKAQLMMREREDERAAEAERMKDPAYRAQKREQGRKLAKLFPKPQWRLEEEQWWREICASIPAGASGSVPMPRLHALHLKMAEREKARRAAQQTPEARAKRRLEREEEKLAEERRKEARKWFQEYLAREEERRKDPAYRKYQREQLKKWFADLAANHIRSDDPQEEAQRRERIQDILTRELSPEEWPLPKPKRKRSR